MEFRKIDEMNGGASSVTIRATFDLVGPDHKPFAQEVVGSVTGLSGLAAELVSAGFTLQEGVLVDRFSYRPAFVVADLLPALATVFISLLIRPPAEAQS